MLNKFKLDAFETLKTYRNELKNKALKPTISKDNSKLGAITSISLLPLITCPNICSSTCATGGCYAVKLAKLYTSCLKSWAKNTALALDRPDVYFGTIENNCKLVSFFRWHVSGDIINRRYFENMIKVAENTPNCKHLVFTKRYKVVNDYIRDGGTVPANLQIIFSKWGTYEPANPYNFPTSNFYNNEIPAPENAFICGGDCTQCAVDGCGCWSLAKGEAVVFKKH